MPLCRASVLLAAIALLALTGCAPRNLLADDGFVDVPGGRVAFLHHSDLVRAEMTA